MTLPIFAGISMADERSRIPGADLGRWLFVVVLLLVGTILYFRYAPSAEPLVQAVQPESTP